MVQMDIIKSIKHIVFIRVIYSLIIFLICYLALVRPARVYVNKHYIAPFYLSFNEDKMKLVTFTSRRINIQPEGYDSPRGFGIPFGGYFWLPFSLFIGVRKNWSAIGLALYHMFLSILPPYLAFLFINQYQWAGALLKVNETLFQGIFLIAVFWGFNSILIIYKEEKERRTFTFK